MRYLTNGLVELLHHDPSTVSDRAWAAAFFATKVAVRVDQFLTGIAKLASALGK